MSIKNECSVLERGVKISGSLENYQIFVKNRTGIATNYTFSDGLRWPTTSRRLIVFSRALITNTSNRVKFTTPISEEEVSVSAYICFFKEGPLLTRNGGTNLFRI